MASTRILLVVAERNAAQANAWIAEQDVHGPGGEFTFTVGLWRIDDDTEVDPPVAFWCNWMIRDSWLQRIGEKVTAAGWKVDSRDTDNDLSQYLASDFIPDQVLNDITRKRVPLKTAEDEDERVQSRHRHERPETFPGRGRGRGRGKH